MKKTATALILAAAALVGCGSDDDAIVEQREGEGPIEGEGGDAIVYEISGWTTERDPLTGEEFRCLTTYRTDYYKAGMGLFCYPMEVRP